MMTYPLRTLSLLLLTACVAAMATGLIAQYGFGLRPCILCLTQRVPFVLAGCLAALSLWRPRWMLPLLCLAALALLINGGIAIYHVGVEHHWWASSCSGGGPTGLVMDLAAEMSKPVEARCDEPAWMWHGITMAAMNIPFSGGLGLLAAFWLWKSRKDV